ncbi:Pkinase-domain-containing protein [Ascodesmis nigricans]|uniref:Pkinase-domain-containing protein n=1 Tax=Ascodesmis nigricans TaxID=341454 RepID=A0A4S2MVM6_9PEZI|nr:Pkinase-domain-containing protein [Ascodesmis nigricans]
MYAPLQNLKNFIRHGKQARQAQDQPPVAQSHAFTEPPPRSNDPSPPQPKPDFSVAADNNRNVAAQAGGAAARAAEAHQRMDHSPAQGGISTSKKTGKAYDQETLAQLVAEEKANRDRLPRYPGLDRWALISKMGDGAFSNVYKARDTQGVYGEVAIKVVRKFELNASQGDKHLHPDMKKGNKVVERANILKEVSIMRRLDHPNIVRLIEFQEDKSYYYLILELCPGGELFHQIVRLTYFSEDLSRHVITQVAEALRYLHEQKGIVHRDIKPENLLFYPAPFIPTRNPKPRHPDDEQKEDEGEFIPGVGSGGIGKIKIADFGLSKVIWEDTTVTPCGTVGYTAPEIVKDERYSKSVDMWALGCVLYTLLCGFPPFYDESISVLTEKVARGQYTFLSPWWDDISKGAKDLVSHLLTVDPEKRYDINQFLAHPWIRRSTEPTDAADDAPPLTGSATGEHAPFVIDPEPSPYLPLDTPGRRMDFRSPGAVSLREVFDVGYAVHRMEEEGKRRKNWKHNYRGAEKNATLNEEDEISDESGDDVPSKVLKDGTADDVADKLRRTKLDPSQGIVAGGSANYAAQTAAARGAPVQKAAVPTSSKTGANSSKRRSGRAFELNIDNATLLGRRKRGGGEETPVAG